MFDFVIRFMDHNFLSCCYCLPICKFNVGMFFLLLQVLGDLVESITGAVLIDSKLNLDEVWRVFKPLLPPIVTPDKLELPLLRELIELCDSLGYFIKESCIPNGDGVQAELILQLEEVRLVGKGSVDRLKKLQKVKLLFIC